MRLLWHNTDVRGFNHVRRIHLSDDEGHYCGCDSWNGHGFLGQETVLSPLFLSFLDRGRCGHRWCRGYLDFKQAKW